MSNPGHRAMVELRRRANQPVVGHHRGAPSTHQRRGSVNVEDLLVQARSDVLKEAFVALQRSHHVHYEAAGDDVTLERLTDLFDLVVAALRERELDKVTAYCEDLAHRRFEAGFGISEVQTAFNVLEETMWARVVAELPPAELANAIGLLTTILGTGKDALARTYVSLASQRHVQTLDLSSYFGQA
jgi:hypothetical protein